MDEESTRKTLLALLERGGAEYVETNGFVRFRTRRDGMLWETLCRCGNGEALIYGRYPFRAEDRAETLSLCSEINSRAVRGAMFLPEDGRAVFRTRAEMSDAYDARERLEEALRYNAAVIARFWGRMANPNM